MTWFRFLIQFGTVSVLTAAVLWALYFFPDLTKYSDLGLISWAVFSVLTVFLFWVAKKAVNHPVRTKFISLTIANMFLKMVFSVGLIWAYYVVKKPENSLFILPFLLVYGIFTIFETRFLLQIANQKK